jgi:hypothetical protein
MSSVDSRSVCNLLKQRCSQCIVHIAKNCTLLHPALIAQLGERQTEDLKVASSILAEGTNLFCDCGICRSLVFFLTTISGTASYSRMQKTNTFARSPAAVSTKPVCGESTIILSPLQSRHG